MITWSGDGWRLIQKPGVFIARSVRGKALGAVKYARCSAQAESTTLKQTDSIKTTWQNLIEFIERAFSPSDG
jgi:hypothetical protein